MRLRALSACVALLCLVTAAPAADLPNDAASKYESIVGQGTEYLIGAQAEDGSWSGYAGPAVTALAAEALMANGRTPSDPVVKKALAYVVGFAKPDGGVYGEGSNHRNYETCLAVMCLSRANKDGRYDALLKKADGFLKGLQWDDGEGHDASSLSYGGAGYGSHERPDLSNTGFFIEALKELGAGPDDPAMQRALQFVSRCQNLETEHNPTEFAAKVNDGGFYYTVAAGGSSQAGETPEGGLRSYGSMTYAGLKSMLFAGVDKDDPRVKAAYTWITKHYTLDENPGMGSSGQYYYYHIFAKALAAMGVEKLDASSGEHDWRVDLIEQLASTQRADGSWVNADERWMESDPNLVTAYSLMALSYAR
ncbi:Prenyltransferase and squalene oxidase repeat protein [Posidoniimonas polymericola]|uniref:Prenyltransferase and squalene oxidase repeat protein n=1 Tax=Posidoniimonas polymericola TaxID=2528002 RepID=A0A5C5YTH7_9BACT|nr:prenyltransferase/squalene oxidase repeat-containing protein [Posidoniimonas polymericola]TWT78111.1 Prenyltransferase and squalene oxidase repeat protein [Posidoniimonas polymericola]